MGYTLHVYTAGGGGIHPEGYWQGTWIHHTPLQVRTAGVVDGYTMHVYTAGGEDWYTMHICTAGGEEGYTRHIIIYSADGGNSAHVHTAGGGKRYTLHSTPYTPCTSILRVGKRSVLAKWCWKISENTGSEFLKALISEHSRFFIMFLKRD